MIGNNLNDLSDFLEWLRDNVDIVESCMGEHACSDSGSESHSAVDINLLVLLVLFLILLDLNTIFLTSYTISGK